MPDHPTSLVARSSRIRSCSIRAAFLACACLWLNATNAQTLQLSTDPETIAVSNFIEYYEDASELLTIDDVLAPNFDVNFIPYDRDLLNFGITSSAYWVRLTLDWSAMPPNAQKILEFGPPKIVGGLVRGGIELYTVDSQREVETEYTLGTLEDEREIKTLSRGLALLLDESFGSEIYIRISSARPLRLPISLWEESTYQLQNCAL